VVSAGIEGLFYTHQLQTNSQLASNNTNIPTVNPSGIVSETCGLVGPAIQIGWHF
jgi:hypothetical protein